MKGIHEIIELLCRIEKSELPEQDTNAGEYGLLRPVFEKLNSMIQAMRQQQQVRLSEEKRLSAALESITRMASLEFTKSLPVLGDGSNMDALAAGLNMLSEELQHSAVSKEELRKRNNLIISIVEHIPVAVFLKDARDSFRITLWNRAAEAIFDIPREDILGKTTHDLFSKEHAERYEADDLRITKEGAPVDIPEEPSHSKIRGPIYLHTQKVPLRLDASGEPSHLLGICEDITRRKKDQITIIQTAKTASLGEMSGSIAHEFNNPLAIIQGKVSQIKRQINKGNLDPTQLTIELSKIEGTVARISKIIKGLRAVSRSSEADKMETVNASSLIEDTLDLSKERFRNKSIDLRVHCEVQGNLECRSAQVIQILINLLNNAHDAVENLPEKWVALSVTNTDSTVVISVTDSGTGISAAVAEKMMLPFFTTKEVGKGTGLGLSISKGIADDHHGTLIYDFASKNTRFVLELPIKQAATS